jgi:hypothetical protein
MKAGGAAMSRFMQVLCAFVLVSSVSGGIAAEVTSLPFRLPEPVFTETAAALPSAFSWMSVEQVLNQADTPDNGHCLDTGTLFTFFSSERLSARGLAREMFQFRPHPDSDFKFWGRALVTDLRLDCSLSLRPLVFSAGYRHDCKHDINATKRDVIHDALFARLVIEEGNPGFLPAVLNAAAGCAFEAELNLPTLFQASKDESDRARLSAEGSFVPFRTSGGGCSVFIDGRFSLIDRERQDRVAVARSWNADWLLRAGTELRAGRGGVRFSCGVERLTDNWASLDPAPETRASVLFTLFSGY